MMETLQNKGGWLKHFTGTLWIMRNRRAGNVRYWLPGWPPTFAQALQAKLLYDVAGRDCFDAGYYLGHLCMPFLILS